LSKPAANRTLEAQKIYALLAQIPEGSVTTYGDLAKAAGCPGGARAVGRILNANPNLVIVPCHRVVKSDGSIGGYAGGIEMKKDLLKKEGVKCSSDRIERFDEIRAVLF
jgi:methylated-DNA-[protein]-cysteine S-methyltransferase